MWGNINPILPSIHPPISSQVAGISKIKEVFRDKAMGTTQIKEWHNRLRYVIQQRRGKYILVLPIISRNLLGKVSICFKSIHFILSEN